MARDRANRKNKPDHLALEAFLPYRLSVLANQVSNGIAQNYEAQYGLRVPEWRVMAVLGRFGANTATGLCRHTAMDKVTVSRATTALFAKDFIQRKIDPDDRRRTIFELATAGQHVHDQIVPMALSYEAQLLDGLSPRERGDLDRLLSKLQKKSESDLS